MQGNEILDLVSQPAGTIMSVEETFNVVNYVMKKACDGEGAGENEGEGEHTERTETDDAGDGPTVDATQATQEGVVESKVVVERKAVEEVAKEDKKEEDVEEVAKEVDEKKAVEEVAQEDDKKEEELEVAAKEDKKEEDVKEVAKDGNKEEDLAEGAAEDKKDEAVDEGANKDNNEEEAVEEVAKEVNEEEAVEEGAKKDIKEKRKNPPRNAKKAVMHPFTDEKTLKKLKKLTKNVTCREWTDFMTWYSDTRFVPSCMSNWTAMLLLIFHVCP